MGSLTAQSVREKDKHEYGGLFVFGEGGGGFNKAACNKQQHVDMPTGPTGQSNKRNEAVYGCLSCNCRMD